MASIAAPDVPGGRVPYLGISGGYPPSSSPLPFEQVRDAKAEVSQWVRRAQAENLELRRRLAGAEDDFVRGAPSDDQRRRRLAYLLTAAPEERSRTGAGLGQRPSSATSLFSASAVIEARERLHEGFRNKKDPILDLESWTKVSRLVCNEAAEQHGRALGLEAQRHVLAEAVLTTEDKLEAVNAALLEERDFVGRVQSQEIARLAEELAHAQPILDGIANKVLRKQRLPLGTEKLKTLLYPLTSAGLARELFNRWRLLRRPLWLQLDAPSGQVLVEDAAKRQAAHAKSVQQRKEARKKERSPSPSPPPQASVRFG